MGYPTLATEKVKLVLECLGFYLDKISSRDTTFIYCYPDSFKRILIPICPVLSKQFIDRIFHRVEDFGISEELIIKCAEKVRKESTD